MSEEHKKYLKSQKKKSILIKLTSFSIIIFILLLWQLAADKNWINTFVSSSPKNILNTTISLYKNGSLTHHISVTLYEVIISFILGTISGIIIATILWNNDFLYKVIDPYLTILNSMPKVSLGPIIIILFGAGTKSIIIMALLISVIITTINVHHSFKSTDVEKIKIMQSLNANKKQIYFKLILPSNINNLINVCKINIGLVFIGVIMGEFLVSKSGIGYLIMYGSQVFNLNLVMTGIILLSVIASLMYYLIVMIEKLNTHQ